MEPSSFFDGSISQYFTAERLGSIIRLSVLLFVILPIILIASKWLKKYSAKKLTAQQGMILSKAILYVGISIVAISFLREVGFKLDTLLGAAGIIGIAIGFASQTSVSNIISWCTRRISAREYTQTTAGSLNLAGSFTRSWLNPVWNIPTGQT